MIFPQRAAVVILQVFEIAPFSPRKVFFDFLVKAALVAFQTQHMISFPRDNLRGNLSLWHPLAVCFDERHPQERLSFMLKDAGVLRVLAQDRLAKRLTDISAARIVSLGRQCNDIAAENADNLGHTVRCVRPRSW